MEQAKTPIHLTARSVRLLSKLSRDAAIVSMPERGSLVLLKFEGKHTLTCPQAVFTAWLSRGLTVLQGEKVSLTSAGRAFLRRKPSVAERALDSDQFASQHRSMAQLGCAGPNGSTQQINTSESPLSRLFALKDGKGEKWISVIEYESGERLRRDFEFAHLGPRITQSFDQNHVAGTRGNANNSVAEMTDTVMGARARLNDAVAAIGPELAGVALDVCCFLKGLELVESERAWPRRSAKVVLKTALAALARHYFPVAKGNQRGAISSWGAEGYRPVINADR